MPLRRAGWRARFGVTGVVAVLLLISYCSRGSFNPNTKHRQFVALSVPEEIALGRQAAPEMIRQYGGLHPDGRAQDRVDRVGLLLVDAGHFDTSYPFEFHLLADSRTINAFALPGGQVFITAGLYARLETEGQLAGVLGHEIGHVIERHGSEHLAKQQLTQGLINLIGTATYDPSRPETAIGGRIAEAVGGLINLKYGRDDELESDRWAVELTSAAGYDPRAMIDVMRLFESIGSGAGQPEILSTHPNPANRAQRLTSMIRERFPDGVPSTLKP
ncbi:MAG: M48 family metalloprotease [Phycisphaeraceae bacterium]|nr:M48 family metalloprotease [Phycisphaeraceae bacterium]